MFTLTGLTEMERARLRYALSTDDTSDYYTEDPFVDVEMELDVALLDIIDLLCGVRDALYEPEEAGGGASKAKTPKVEKRPVDKKKPEKASTPKTGDRKYVNWNAIIEQLNAGEIDEFVHTMKAGSAWSTKKILSSKFDNLDITTENIANGMALVTITLAQ